VTGVTRGAALQFGFDTLIEQGGGVLQVPHHGFGLLPVALKRIDHGEPLAFLDGTLFRLGGGLSVDACLKMVLPGHLSLRDGTKPDGLRIAVVQEQEVCQSRLKNRPEAAYPYSCGGSRQGVRGRLLADHDQEVARGYSAKGKPRLRSYLRRCLAETRARDKYPAANPMTNTAARRNREESIPMAFYS
jgi:hypothetical protein